MHVPQLQQPGKGKGKAKRQLHETEEGNNNNSMGDAALHKAQQQQQQQQQQRQGGYSQLRPLRAGHEIEHLLRQQTQAQASQVWRGQGWSVGGNNDEGGEGAASTAVNVVEEVSSSSSQRSTQRGSPLAAEMRQHHRMALSQSIGSVDAARTTSPLQHQQQQQQQQGSPGVANMFQALHKLQQPVKFVQTINLTTIPLVPGQKKPSPSQQTSFIGVAGSPSSSVVPTTASSELPFHGMVASSGGGAFRVPSPKNSLLSSTLKGRGERLSPSALFGASPSSRAIGGGMMPSVKSTMTPSPPPQLLGSGRFDPRVIHNYHTAVAGGGSAGVSSRQQGQFSFASTNAKLQHRNSYSSINSGDSSHTQMSAHHDNETQDPTDLDREFLATVNSEDRSLADSEEITMYQEEEVLSVSSSFRFSQHSSYQRQQRIGTKGSSLHRRANSNENRFNQVNSASSRSVSPGSVISAVSGGSSFRANSTFGEPRPRSRSWDAPRVGAMVEPEKGLVLVDSFRQVTKDFTTQAFSIDSLLQRLPDDLPMSEIEKLERWLAQQRQKQLDVVTTVSAGRKSDFASFQPTKTSGKEIEADRTQQQQQQLQRHSQQHQQLQQENLNTNRRRTDSHDQGARAPVETMFSSSSIDDKSSTSSLEISKVVHPVHISQETLATTTSDQILKRRQTGSPGGIKFVNRFSDLKESKEGVLLLSNAIKTAPFIGSSSSPKALKTSQDGIDKGEDDDPIAGSSSSCSATTVDDSLGSPTILSPTAGPIGPTKSAELVISPKSAFNALRGGNETL